MLYFFRHDATLYDEDNLRYINKPNGNPNSFPFGILGFTFLYG